MTTSRRHFLAAVTAGGTLAGLRVRATDDGRLVTQGETIPIAGTYDLVVAGGSTTGVAAAVTAARAGLSVAIVEYNAFFGGTATAGLVPVWHSLYSTDGARQIIGGITEEIEQKLLARGEARLLGKTDKSVGCYLNVAALEIALDELVRGAKTIESFLKAQVVDAVLDRPGHLTHVVIEDRDGRRALAARQFIDATGDAVLAARAGFKTWTQPRSDLQAHTLCAILSGADAIKKAYPSFSFGKLMGPSGGAGLKHVFQWSAPVIGAPGLTFLAATRISACDPSVARDLTEGLFEGRAQLKQIVDAANRKFPMSEGKRLALVTVAPDMGLRESRHIVAQYRVTSKDRRLHREGLLPRRHPRRRGHYLPLPQRRRARDGGDARGENPVAARQVAHGRGTVSHMVRGSHARAPASWRGEPVLRRADGRLRARSLRRAARDGQLQPDGRGCGTRRGPRGERAVHKWLTATTSAGGGARSAPSPPSLNALPPHGRAALLRGRPSSC